VHAGRFTVIDAGGDSAKLYVVVGFY